MVDFRKKILNSDKFRSPAIHFQQYGLYTFEPAGTEGYIKYWNEQMSRCLDGYTADDGDWISGYHYFYLNFCQIERINKVEKIIKGEKKNVRIRYKEFPSFYDYDYYFFLTVQEAEDEGKHLCVLKSRRKGYSYKIGSMMNRNFYLVPGSKSYAYAAEKEFLIKDGILTKAWENMSFIDKNTAWGKKRQVKSNDMHRRASYEERNESGNKIESGYMSEIIGVTLNNDPHKARGKAGKLIIFEESGKFPHLIEAWQVARPSVEQDGIAHGLMISFGTGGTVDSDFSGLKKLFYESKTYNVKTMPNIWEDGAEDREVGFFVPQYTNLNVYDDDGSQTLMDEYGNTNTEKAKKYVLDERQIIIDNATDSRDVDRHIAEQCITPTEACLEVTGNIFPKKELMNQLASVRNNSKIKGLKQVGDLIFSEGHLTWSIKNHGDITEYPLPRDRKTDGSIVIWEHPPANAPLGMYIAGCDPYDHDQSGTNSLGSIFIYKRVQHFETYHDVVVAEYTGRPDTAEDYYENVRKLLLYYNARALYENMWKGMFTYFTNKGCDYLLADQPDILSDISINTKVQRKKGIHMTKEIKLYGIGLIKEWLNEEFEPGHKNLTRIYSEPLLEELISYNDAGNFDRVIALILVMIYRLQLYKNIVREHRIEENNIKLFNSPIYTSRSLDIESDTTMINIVSNNENQKAVSENKIEFKINTGW